MARRYHALRAEDAADGEDAAHGVPRALSEAEEELLALLKARGVRGIVAAVSKEIHYAWAVASGLRTLRDAGRFYLACGARAFGYNPAPDFFAAHGLQLALFALRRFAHDALVLAPALDCVAVYCRLDAAGALEFLAVPGAADMVLNCARFHDNKPDVISAACHALGALVLNDAVREELSSPELVRELLGLVRRYAAVQSVCRAALAPLGFLVTGARETEAFAAADGVALVSAALEAFRADAELVWHALGLLNALHGSALDARALAAALGGAGVARAVAAVAAHLDAEEVAVEGFRLLAHVAPRAPRQVHAARALDLLLLARFAYAGEQHRHTRRALQAALPALRQAALRDPAARAARERSPGSRATRAALAATAAALAAATAASLHDAQAAAVARAVRLQLERDAVFWDHEGEAAGGRPRLRALRDVATPEHLWRFLRGPLRRALLAPPSADAGAALAGRAHLLVGGLQLRRLGVRATACATAYHAAIAAADEAADEAAADCFPPYSRAADDTAASATGNATASADATAWAADARAIVGRLGEYPGALGDRRLLLPGAAAAAELDALHAARWLDPQRARALVASFNLYTPAADVHTRVELLFELPAAGGAVRPAPARVQPLRLRAFREPAARWAAPAAAELALLGCLAWLAAAQAARLARDRWLFLALRRHVRDALALAAGAAAVSARARALGAASFALRRRLARAAAAGGYVELAALAHLARAERQALACLAAIVWWRLARALGVALGRPLRGLAALDGVAALLALAALGAAHAAAALDGGDSGRGLDLGVMHVLRAAAAAVPRWPREPLEALGAAAYDASARASADADAPADAARLALEIASLVLALSVAACALRDRRDAAASIGADAAHREDELRMLEIAKRRLEAHGLRVHETSLAQKLRARAAAGMERLQGAVRAKADDALDLLDLRRAWGRPELGESENGSDGEDENEEGRAAADASKRGKRGLAPTERLGEAEQRERELEQRLGGMARRVNGIAALLAQFQCVVREEMLPTPAPASAPVSDV